MDKKTALIAGASGLIGSALLSLLLKQEKYTQVISLGRRTLNVQHPKLVQLKADFNDLENIKLDSPVSDAFCCLGTTIKKAGSQDAFRKVDHDFIINFAKCALKSGAGSFFLVSSLGADSNSSIFYSKVKGEVEAVVMNLSFDNVHIFQPSLLLGKREESRPLEYISQVLMGGLDPLIGFAFGKYRAIKGADVAKGMLNVALNKKTGKVRYPSNFIKDLAKEE